MPRIVKNTLLKYIPESFSVESRVAQQRIFTINNKSVKDGDVLYIMDRELRFWDNFSLNYAIELAESLSKNLKIIHLKRSFDTTLKQEFYEKNLKKLEDSSVGLFEFYILESLKNIDAGVVVMDFNPIGDKSYLKDFSCRVFEVDSHNIVPARFVSDKQEYNAATFRRKLYKNIASFLTEFPKNKLKSNIDVGLSTFISNKLSFYCEEKNNPFNDVTSGFSKFLNFGFVSSQRIALEVIKSSASDDNKECFLEELIIRNELSDNFCLYCDDYKSFKFIPAWAKSTLSFHKNDIRPFIYTIEDFESSKTHDDLWNYAQATLVRTGSMHGYLRMYWAKKILEWSVSPDEALKIAIYLNDKYELDSPSPNGYVGILWAIGGLHDRAFQERPVFGKIRYMKNKFKNFL